MFQIIAAAAITATLAIDHYKLHQALDPADHSLTGDAEITIRNRGDRPITTVPVLLYRLMDVKAASDGEGKPLPFVQKVVKFPDEAAWQVNAAAVTLSKKLPPGGTTRIRVTYAGPLFGYREVMQYVRDTISEEYSLIRPETMAYPLIAVPSFAGWRESFRNSFDYEVETDVPAGFVAVCSGTEAAAPETKDGRTLYRCAGEKREQIGVAAAKFHVLDDAAGHLRIYAMPADATAAERLMTEMRRALDFYRSYFGEMQRAGSLTLIEIPEGWGSYALPGHIFQEAVAFKDPTQAPALYHEVGHIWNAKPADRVQRARWFDEAFASYFEALAVRQFQGEDAFRAHMESYRPIFIKRAARDPRGRTTPIAEYGKEEIGGFSYTKGAWSLYVLHTILGEETFRRSMSEFLRTYADKPADFQDFRRSIEKTSGRNLQGWFTQWITGANDSSAMLIDGKSVEEMAAAAQAR